MSLSLSDCLNLALCEPVKNNLIEEDIADKIAKEFKTLGRLYLIICPKDSVSKYNLDLLNKVMERNFVHAVFVLTDKTLRFEVFKLEREEKLNPV